MVGGSVSLYMNEMAFGNLKNFPVTQFDSDSFHDAVILVSKLSNDRLEGVGGGGNLNHVSHPQLAHGFLKDDVAFS